MDVLINSTVEILPQCVHISSLHIMHFKHITILFATCNSIREIFYIFLPIDKREIFYEKLKDSTFELQDYIMKVEKYYLTNQHGKRIFHFASYNVFTRFVSYFNMHFNLLFLGRWGEK